MSTPGPSLPSSQASHLLSSFTSFLTVAIHSLLYHRNLYPPTSFLTARAYNLPVHQSRHPLVCAWIRDATRAVAAQLRAAAARHVVLVAYGPHEGGGGGAPPVLERWVFDVRSFPAWGRKSDRHALAALGDGDEVEERQQQQQQQQSEDQDRGDQDVNWTDVNEALRGALRRIAYTAESMPSLPDGCTFTLAVELRDEAEAPISHPQSWIPSQTSISPPSPGFIQNENQSLNKKHSSSTVPIRSVRADPLFFECWVEQRDDDNLASTSTGKSQPAGTNDTDPSSSR